MELYDRETRYWHHLKRGSKYESVALVILKLPLFIFVGEGINLTIIPAGGSNYATLAKPKNGFIVAELQTAKPIENDEILLLYKDKHKNWLRPISEFHDGRYIKIDKVDYENS